jgi:hypothetical protein
MLAVHQADLTPAPLAKWTDANPIPEIQVATGMLDSLHDIHFGICNHDYDRHVAKDVRLLGLGPRILDIANRGGRTAEDSWRLIAQKRQDESRRENSATCTSDGTSSRAM